MRPPKKPTTSAQSYAVNHVAKFLDECCVLGSGHVSISAMCKAYVLWCEAREVRHRRLDLVPFLAVLEQDHGIVAGKCCWTEDGEERSAYALRGVRFRDGRLERLRRDKERDGLIGDPANAHRELTGRIREADDDEDGELRESPRMREPSYETEPDEKPSAQERRRAYYIANRERILAKKRERSDR